MGYPMHSIYPVLELYFTTALSLFDYSMNIASPKLKKRYFSCTAVS